MTCNKCGKEMDHVFRFEDAGMTEKFSCPNCRAETFGRTIQFDGDGKLIVKRKKKSANKSKMRGEVNG